MRALQVCFVWGDGVEPAYRAIKTVVAFGCVRTQGSSQFIRRQIQTPLAVSLKWANWRGHITMTIVQRFFLGGDESR